MTDVSIEYDAANELLLLRGIDEKLRRNPLLAAYIRQEKGFNVSPDEIHLPTVADALTDQYQRLSRLLERIGSGLKAGGHVSDVLDAVEAEEARFQAFSSHAQEIWRGEIDSDEFREFVRTIELHCPGRTFYRKQLLSAFHLAFSQNSCNFSVPGAGKTSIVYLAYAYLASLPLEDPKVVDRLLIVGPLSSFKAWEDEYKAIFLRTPNSKRLNGAVPLQERVDYLRGISLGSRDVELTLTTYQTIANAEDEFRIFLKRGGKRTMMVLDEAHYIKSADGQQANATLRLANLAHSRVVLTGTPAPNGYEDLANLFRFIYPTRNIIGFPSATLRAMNDGAMATAVEELKIRLQPYFTRIRKSDLGLPGYEEIRVPIEMGESHERIYRGLERKIVPYFHQAVEKPEGLIRVKARLIRLRQACVNPELLLKPLSDEGVFDTGGTGDFTVSELEVADLITEFDADRDLERLSACKTLVEDILERQGKVLIWSYFLGNLQKLKTALSAMAPFIEVLTGATPTSNGDLDDNYSEGSREAIIDGFHQAKTKAILIANPQAVGESISLHKACRSAIYFDRDFNAGRFIQSKDRIHRYNPDGGLPVSYYYLMSNGTVDDNIDSRLQIKESRLLALVDADDIPLLTGAIDGDGAEDIRAILDAYERRKTK